MTFTWLPEFGLQKQTSPNVDVVQFGDGYENRVGKGINIRRSTWNLSFAYRDTAEGMAIISFLETANGLKSFDWVPPFEGASVKVVCREWSLTIDKANLYTIQASFVRVYEP